MPDADQPTTQPPFSLPRISITYCTKCKWMLRAAYANATRLGDAQLAQELLSTFNTSLGEVALIPGPEDQGGIFKIEITYRSKDEVCEMVQGTVLWDRGVEGGFPETKVLKRRVRDVIDPERGLGHVDRGVERGEEKGKGRSGEEGGGEGAVVKGECVGEECG